MNLRFAMFLLLFSVWIFNANCSTIVVSTFFDLQNAISSSPISSIAVTNDIFFSNEITIPGSSRITIQGQTNNIEFSTSGFIRLFLVSSNATLSISNITLTSTRASTFTSNGGFISSNGTVILSQASLSSGSGICGSAIYSFNGTLIMTNVSVEANEAMSLTCGGAVYADRSFVNITDSAFTNNTASYGAAVYATTNSILYVTGSTFNLNTASGMHGGAMYIVGSSLFMRNSNVKDNFAVANGGGLYVNDIHRSELIQCTFTGNNATGSGGQVFVLHSRLTISKSTLVGGFADNEGGAVVVSSGTVKLHSVVFYDNIAGDSGGAVHCFNGGHVTVIGCTLNGNSATSYGGSLNFIQKCRGTVEQSTFINSLVPLTNTATSAGGAISCSGAGVNVGFTSFSSSFAGQGSAIYTFNCELSVSFSSFFNLTAQDSSIYSLDNSILTLFGNNFVNNTGTSYSNGVSCVSTQLCHARNNTFRDSQSFELGTFYVEATEAIIINSIFLNNVATGAGAGVFAKKATVEIFNSTFIGNAARTYGGAVTSEISSQFRIVNCFFGNNSASNGGAMYGFFGSQFDVSNTSFHANRASDSGGALYLADESFANITMSHFHHNFAAVGAVFFVSGNAAVEMFQVHTHTNHAGFSGGVALVSNLATFTARQCQFMNNSAAMGGVIAIQYLSHGYFSGCMIMDNKATAFGGALYVVADSSAFVENTHFSGNAGDFGGGVAQLELSSANFSQVTCTHNMGAYGAVAQCIGSTLTARNSVFAHNGARDVYEGGVFSLSSGGHVSSLACQYTNNVAIQAAVATVKLSSFTSVNDIFQVCQAYVAGCFLATQNSLVNMQGSIVRENYMPAGALGGVFVISSSNFTANNVTFTNNHVQTQGVLSLMSSDAALQNMHFLNNMALAHSARAAAVYFGCAVPCTTSGGSYVGLVNGSVFHGNQAIMGYGGAMMSENYPGRVSVTHSTFTFNKATNGGAVAAAASILHIASSKFLYNVALEGGGGVYWEYSSLYPTIIDTESCKVRDNHAAYGYFTATNLVRLFVSNSNTNANNSQGTINVNGNDTVDTYLEQVSGQALVTPIEVLLQDFYEQTVTNTSSQLSLAETTVYVAVYNDTGLLRGSSIVSPVNGSAIFSQLVLVGRPGGTITLTFSVAASLVPSILLTLPFRACSPGEITLPVASTSGFYICQPCPAGTYSFSPTDTSCHVCPNNAVCPGRNLIDVSPGYWRTDDTSSNVLPCPVPQVCLGGYNTSQQCVEGQTGPYCSVCQDGYAQSGTGTCYSCASSNKLSTELVSTFLFLTLLIIFIVVMKKSKQLMKWYSTVNQRLWRNRRIRTLRVKGKILISFAQIVYQLGPSLNVVFPVNFLTYLNFYSFLSLNLAFLPDIDCIVRTNFYTDLVISTVAPIALYGLIVLCLQVMVRHAQRLNQRNPYYTPSQASSDTIAAMFFISYFVLISVSTKIFEVFQCETFDDGQSFLVADYSISCDSPEYMLYRFYGSAMILVYPLGIPFAYAFILVRHRHKINPNWRQVIDAKEKALVSKRVIQREKIKVRKTFDEIRNLSLLFDSYIPRRWYFEIFDCGRRLLLGAIPVLILRGSSLQIVIVLLISLASSGVFMSTQPYIHKHDNQLAILAQWSITFVVLASLVIKIQALQNTSNNSTTSSNNADNGDGNGGSSTNDGLGVILILLNVFVLAVTVISTMLNSKEQLKDINKDDDKESNKKEKDKEKGMNLLGFMRGDSDEDDDIDPEESEGSDTDSDPHSDKSETDEHYNDAKEEDEEKQGGKTSNSTKSMNRPVSQPTSTKNKRVLESDDKGVVRVGYNFRKYHNNNDDITNNKTTKTKKPKNKHHFRKDKSHSNDSSDYDNSNDSSADKNDSLESDPEMNDHEKRELNNLYYTYNNSDNNNDNNNNKINNYNYFAQKNPLHFVNRSLPNVPKNNGTNNISNTHNNSSEGINMQTFKSEVKTNSSVFKKESTEIDSDDEI